MSDWKPPVDFRFDLSILSLDDLDSASEAATRAKYEDLTHLKHWKQAMEHYQADVTVNKAPLLANPFLALFAGALNKVDLTHGIKPRVDAVLDRINGQITKYVNRKNRAAAVHITDLTILAQEKENRLKHGNILEGDLIKGNYDNIRRENPDADYVGRAKWIVDNLEPVKDIFKEDYNYWKDLLDFLKQQHG